MSTGPHRKTLQHGDSATIARSSRVRARDISRAAGLTGSTSQPQQSLRQGKVESFMKALNIKAAHETYNVTFREEILSISLFIDELLFMVFRVEFGG
jgi:hypothetical protein